MAKKLFVSMSGNGADRLYQFSVSGVTKGATTVVEFSGTPTFQVGDQILFSLLGGITQINGQTGTIISLPSATSVEVNIDTTVGYSNYTSGGNCSTEKKAIQSITNANPAVVGCIGHGFTNGNAVSFFDIIGMTELNDRVYYVQNATADTFELAGVDSTAFGTFTSGFLVPTYATPKYAIDRLLAVGGDEICIEETGGITTHNLGNATFTLLTNSVATAVDYTGVLAAGDFFGKPTAAGNGAEETFYKILTISPSLITFEGYYSGDTGTVGGLRRLVPKAEGLSGLGIVQSTKALTVSGGWDFSTNLQDKQTWFKHAISFTVGTQRGLNISGGCNVNKINCVDVYENLVGTGCTIDECSLGGYVYSLQATGTPCSILNSRIMPNKGPSWNALRLATVNPIVQNTVVGSWHTVGSIAISVAADIDVDLSTCKVKGAGYGVELFARSKIICPEISYCSQGIRLSVYGPTVENVNIKNCTTGINIAGTCSGFFVKGGSIDQCSTGIQSTQSVACRFENIAFSNNNFDYSQDQYSSNNTFVNCSHTSPLTRCYDRVAQSGAIIIIGCSVDPASANKVFLQTSLDNFIQPQFLLQDSFGFTGAYYGKFEVVKNTLTSPPSVQMKFNTGVSKNYADFKIASTYTTQGAGKTLRFKLEALTAGWSGTIVPKIKLNQNTVQTETSITSVSYGSEDSYEYTVPGGSIYSDGELSIEFNVNSNTIAVIVKEFEVESA
jgi:hypothetical protein